MTSLLVYPSDKRLLGAYTEEIDPKFKLVNTFRVKFCFYTISVHPIKAPEKSMRMEGRKYRIYALYDLCDFPSKLTSYLNDPL